jgi:hypothetical protein
MLRKLILEEAGEPEVRNGYRGFRDAHSRVQSFQGLGMEQGSVLRVPSYDTT